MTLGKFINMSDESLARSLVNKLYGGAEIGAMIGSAVVSEVGAGYAGLSKSGAFGYGSDKATEAVESFRDKYTYQPRSETAKGWLESAAPYVEKAVKFIDRKATDLETATGGKISREATKAILQSAVELSPFIAGKAVKTIKAGKPARETTTQQAYKRLMQVKRTDKQVKKGKKKLTLVDTNKPEDYVGDTTQLIQNDMMGVTKFKGEAAPFAGLRNVDNSSPDFDQLMDFYNKEIEIYEGVGKGAKTSTYEHPSIALKRTQQQLNVSRKKRDFLKIMRETIKREFQKIENPDLVMERLLHATPLDEGGISLVRNPSAFEKYKAIDKQEKIIKTAYKKDSQDFYLAKNEMDRKRKMKSLTKQEEDIKSLRNEKHETYIDMIGTEYLRGNDVLRKIDP